MGNRRGRVGSVLGILAALLLALSGVGLVLPSAQASGTTYSFSDAGCTSANMSTLVTDLQNAMSNGESITYTGAFPCTVELNGTTLTVPSSTVSITIEGGVGLTFDEQNTNNDVIDMESAAAGSSLALDHVTVENGLLDIDDQDTNDVSLNLTNSTITGSRGIGINASGASGTVTVANSTISGNGDEAIDDDYSSATITVTNSTLIGNQNNGIGAAYAAGSINVVSSTISESVAYGIVVFNSSTTVRVSTTILADNQFGNCYQADITDGGYNISANAAGNDGSCGLTASTSRQNVTDGQLNLQPLADNGGPTWTQALGPGSVAIDAIPVNGQGQCVAGTQVDQRGVVRPQGQGCDIGAFEVAYPVTVQPGSTATVHQGYFALLRFSPTDAQGNDLASQTIPATTVALDGPNGQVIPFVHPLQFVMAHHTAQYQLALNTRQLAPGTWNLEVKVGSGASASYGWITFTVE